MFAAGVYNQVKNCCLLCEVSSFSQVEPKFKKFAFEILFLNIDLWYTRHLHLLDRFWYIQSKTILVPLFPSQVCDKKFVKRRCCRFDAASVGKYRIAMLLALVELSFHMQHNYLMSSSPLQNLK